MADSNDSLTGQFQLSHTLQLQRQAGCFNYNPRVVTLVAKNWRDSGYVRFVQVLKTKLIQKEAAQFLLQPQYTDSFQNICEGVITNAFQSCSKELPCS